MSCEERSPSNSAQNTTEAHSVATIFFQSLTREQLGEFLIPLSLTYKPRYPDSPDFPAFEAKAKKRAHRWAKQLFQWFYAKKVPTFELMTDLPLMLREYLSAKLPILRMQATLSNIAQDGTHKYLWQLVDKKTVESVMIPAQRLVNAHETHETYATENDDEDQEENTKTHATASQSTSLSQPPVQEGQRFRGLALNQHFGPENKKLQITRRTICISSQVGCAMKCAFCLTGIQGMDRNLSVAEIVSQVYEVALQYPLNNIVFMGMGEPLNNLDNVIAACNILLDQEGLNFSKRKITISTSGLVPKIQELGQRCDVSLAISLNATTDEVRSAIMPVNKAWNIATLLSALRSYPTGSHRRITFEYVLLSGINDSLQDAQRLVALVAHIPHKVNLIPFNTHPGSDFKRPSDPTIQAFHRFLLDHNVAATVRISRGQDILAACGQLRSSQGTARGSERHADF